MTLAIDVMSSLQETGDTQFGNEACMAFRGNQRGVTSIEYALIASLIAIAIVVGIQAVGGANGNNWFAWTAEIAEALGF